jgi:RecA-family ATPase
MIKKSIGASAPRTIADRPLIQFSDFPQPSAFAIKGIIPEGIGIISGTGGVGKTSCIVPLALSVAGITANGSNLEVEKVRKVVYITEDQTQVELILHGMRHFLKWNDETWQQVKENFLVLSSMRMNYDLLTALLADCKNGIFDLKPPLLVIDTASANLEVQNESDNSEISRMMSVMKEHAAKNSISVWIVTHLAKGAKGQSIDEIRKFGARGAGAWEDNAQWTAILAATKEDNEGDRIFKMGKRRAVLAFDEISFAGHDGTIEIEGRPDVNYRYTVGNKGSAYLRKQAAAIEWTEVFVKRFRDAFAKCTKEYPTKSDIVSLAGGKKQTAMNKFEEFVAQGVIVEVEIPESARELRGGKFTYKMAN